MLSPDLLLLSGKEKVWRAARWGFYAHSTYNDHIRNILHQWYHAEPEVD